MRTSIVIGMKHEIPLFALLKYLNEINDLYYHYLCINSLIDALSKGIFQYKIGRNESFTNYLPRKPIIGFEEHIEYKETVIIGQNERRDLLELPNEMNSIDKIYKKIIERPHPKILYKNKYGYEELVNEEVDGLIINKLQVNSPPEITFNGLDGVINQIFYGKEIEKRAKENHELEKIDKSIRNVEKLISLDEKLASSKISDCHKAYLEEMIAALKRNQERLITGVAYEKIEITI